MCTYDYNYVIPKLSASASATRVKERKRATWLFRNQFKMEEFEVSSVASRYHIYKETWPPFLTEHLECKREEGNDKDRYAVAVLRHDSVVGHIA